MILYQFPACSDFNFSPSICYLLSKGAAYAHRATRLYADTDLGFDLDNTIYALDSTTIDLCLSLFPWARFCRTQAAVKTQIWIAVSVYVLVTIIKKRLALDQSLYRILQILSFVLFDKRPILQVFSEQDYKTEIMENHNQLEILDF